MKPTEELDWRKNLHDTVRFGLHTPGVLQKLPQVIIDAIDAAYVQGLEDGKKEENKEWRERRRCLLCGEPKEPSVLSDNCDRCWKNG